VRECFKTTESRKVVDLPLVRLSVEWRLRSQLGNKRETGAEVSQSHNQNVGEQACCLVPNVLAKALSIRLLAYAWTPKLLYIGNR